jgi:hypothetical protein
MPSKANSGVDERNVGCTGSAPRLTDGTLDLVRLLPWRSVVQPGAQVDDRARRTRLIETRFGLRRVRRCN